MDRYRQSKSVFIKSREALLAIMKDKVFDQISTKEIAEGAGFSRQYFYRFYKDKMDLVFDIFEYDLSVSVGEVYYPGKTSNAIIENLIKNQWVYKSLLESSYSAETTRMFLDSGAVFIKAISKSSYLKAFGREEDEALNFYLYSVVYTLIDVIKNGKNLSAGELTQLFYKNVPPALEYLKNEIITGEVIIYQIEKYKGGLRRRK